MIRLYPPVPIKAQSFEGTPRLVVPNQSMTLQEIIKRFIRKEALPIGRRELYEDRMGDLEKMANMDMTEAFERAAEIKEGLARRQAADDKKAKKAKEASEVKVDPPKVDPPKVDPAT